METTKTTTESPAKIAAYVKAMAKLTAKMMRDGWAEEAEELTRVAVARVAKMKGR